VRAANERADLPLDTRMKLFKDLLVEKGVRHITKVFLLFKKDGLTSLYANFITVSERKSSYDIVLKASGFWWSIEVMWFS